MATEPTTVLADLHFAEAPHWHEGRLWFSDFYADAIGGRVLRVTDGGTITREVRPGMPVYACAVGGAAGRTLFACVAAQSSPRACGLPSSLIEPARGGRCVHSSSLYMALLSSKPDHLVRFRSASRVGAVSGVSLPRSTEPSAVTTLNMPCPRCR